MVIVQLEVYQESASLILILFSKWYNMVEEAKFVPSVKGIDVKESDIQIRVLCILNGWLLYSIPCWN